MREWFHIPGEFATEYGKTAHLARSFEETAQKNTKMEMNDGWADFLEVTISVKEGRKIKVKQERIIIPMHLHRDTLEFSE